MRSETESSGKRQKSDNEEPSFSAATTKAEANATIRYVTRTVEDSYPETFAAFAKEQQSQPKTLAVFAFLDKQDATLAHEVQWYTDDKAMTAAMAKDAHLGKILSNITFGGSTAEKLLSGYVKLDGENLAGPPVFEFTTRRVKMGELPSLAKAFDSVCQVWREKVPGILAGACYADPNQPDTVQDLRILANWEQHRPHIKAIADANLFGDWFGHYDKSLPFTGIVFSDDGTKFDSKGGEGFLRYDYGNNMIGAVPKL